jgi:hypothetical protein
MIRKGQTKEGRKKERKEGERQKRGEERREGGGREGGERGGERERKKGRKKGRKEGRKKAIDSLPFLFLRPPCCHLCDDLRCYTTCLSCCHLGKIAPSVVRYILLCQGLPYHFR